MRNPKCEICTYEWIRGCTRRCCYILSRDALFVDSSLGSFRMSSMTEKQKGDHNIGARSRNEARQQVSYDITSAAAVLFFFFARPLTVSQRLHLSPFIHTSESHPTCRITSPHRNHSLVRPADRHLNYPTPMKYGVVHQIRTCAKCD